MATTKIWAIKDSVKRVIEYARNPEKTEYADLKNAIHYAADGKKTEFFEDEKVFLVTSLNCNGDPYESMMQVREHFGDRGSILAHHAYQSFKPGEVTPEECHSIGVELAQRLWGERYQVMVATHLNKSHLHNHFIVNPISFIDGKKIDSGYKNYYALREASDQICFEHGLSVIKNPQGRTPRSIYFDEKAGKNTRYNLMRKAIDEAVDISPSWQDFFLHLREKGYELDVNPDRKYPRIKSINEQKWTRLYRLGEKYTVEAFNKIIEENRRYKLCDYYEYVNSIKIKNISYLRDPERHHWSRIPEKNYGPLLTLVLTFVYLIGGPDLITPEDPYPKHYPITPEMREATRRCEMYSRQAKLMGHNNIQTYDEAVRFLRYCEDELVALERKRKAYYNQIRRCDDPELKAQVQSDIRDMTGVMRNIRRNIKDIKNVIERSVNMKAMVDAEEKAYGEKISREFWLTRAAREELQRALPDTFKPQDTVKAKAKVKRRDDYER